MLVIVRCNALIKSVWNLICNITSSSLSSFFLQVLEANNIIENTMKFQEVMPEWGEQCTSFCFCKTMFWESDYVVC